MQQMRTHLWITSLTALLWVPVIASAQQDFNRLKSWDANGDGKITKDEFPERVRNRFDQLDSDRDGAVTHAEFDAFRQRRDAPRERPAAAPVKPTHVDVAYGDHEKQAFDLWLAKPADRKPTPMVIYIHGGGFRGGDKQSAAGHPIGDYLDKGISFASMNYRLSDEGPFPIMMHDCARGLQTIRSRAKEWNLDPDRIACYGGSAGAGISLWLGFHEDLADPESDDPIARQSTRIVAAATQGGQSTYDLRTFRQWFDVPNLKPHPALVPFYAVESDDDWESERVKQLMQEASPIHHLTKDDPPVFMSYNQGDVPVDENSSPGLWVHHARLGIKLQEAMEKLGLECHVTWRDHPSPQYDDLHGFLQAKVGTQKPQDARSARTGRTNRNGEYYAPPAMQERVDSRLKIGDRAPEFSLPTADGRERVSLSQFEGKTVVLVFGSITCGPFRQKVTQVFDLHKKYTDNAEFLMVYLREAHPESTILIPETSGESVLQKFNQTDTLDGRIANARSCTALLDVPFPMLIDSEDNGTLTAYGAWPNRLVVVDQSGKIAWDSGEGPRGFQPQKLDDWLNDNL